MFSELLLELYHKRSKRNTDFEAKMSSLKRKVRKLKDTTVLLLEDHFECGMFTMTFPFFGHLCDDLEKFRSIKFLDAAPCDQFRVVLERA